MQKDKENEYNPKLLENKNALLMVGRMGQGKTSACKMFVNDSEKHRIRRREGIKTETVKCETYMSNMFKDIFGEDIVVVDTPGLESKATVSLLVEDIDELILEHKLNIVGIAYVLDIKQRDQNQDGQSFIFTFLDLLRVKYCYKINLIFFLLSKYDIYWEMTQSNMELMKQFSDLFIMKDSALMWERRIQWMSQPVLDQDVFHRKKDLYLKKEYDDQFQTLKKFLRRIKEQGHILRYKSYESDRNQFEALFKDSLIKDKDKFQYQNQIDSFELNIEVKQVQKGILKLASQYSKMVLGSIGISWAVQTGINFVSQSLQKKKIGSLSDFFMTLTIGWASFSYIRKRLDALLEDQYSENYKQAMNSQTAKYIYIKRIEQKLKFFLIKAAMDQCKIKGNVFTMKRLPYIVNIQSFDENSQQNQLNQTQQNGQLIIKTNLSVGRNRVIFSYKTPSKYYYEGFLRKHSSIFYNNKK